MREAKFSYLAFIGVMVLSVAQVSGRRQTLGAVCSNAPSPCKSSYQFTSYQLPFEIKETLVFGRSYKSVPFYAVILQSVAANTAADCAHVSEKQRLDTQTLFADRKVFASRFSCAEELILYTNVNQQFNFLAVYAGTTKAEAREVLNKVKASNRYPQAQLRRMQVVLEFST